MTSLSCDIAVVGGGLAGLITTARLLAAGFDVVCLERAPLPKGAPTAADLRTTAFLAPSVELLRAAGVWDALQPYAAPMQVMRIIDCDLNGRAGYDAAFRASDIGQDQFGVNIANAPARAALIAHIRAIGADRLLDRAEPISLIARDDAAYLGLSDGRRVIAQVVVAADGRESTLRRLCGISARTTTYPQKAVVCAVDHNAPHNDSSTEIHRDKGPCVLAPMPGRRSAVVWMTRPSEAAALTRLPTDVFNAAVTDRTAGVLGELRLASDRAAWPIIARLADRFHAPRVALMAEAAHVVPPIGAQGLNMSLADAALLTQVLSEARAARRDLGAAAGLARYGAARRTEAITRMAGIDMLNRVSIGDNALLRGLRRTGLQALHQIAPARRLIMRAGLGA